MNVAFCISTELVTRVMIELLHFGTCVICLPMMYSPFLKELTNFHLVLEKSLDHHHCWLEIDSIKENDKS